MISASYSNQFKSEASRVTDFSPALTVTTVLSVIRGVSLIPNGHGPKNTSWSRSVLY